MLMIWWITESTSWVQMSNRRIILTTVIHFWCLTGVTRFAARERTRITIVATPAFVSE